MWCVSRRVARHQQQRLSDETSSSSHTSTPCHPCHHTTGMRACSRATQQTRARTIGGRFAGDTRFRYACARRVLARVRALTTRMCVASRVLLILWCVCVCVRSLAMNEIIPRKRDACAGGRQNTGRAAPNRRSGRAARELCADKKKTVVVRFVLCGRKSVCRRRRGLFMICLFVLRCAQRSMRTHECMQLWRFGSGGSSFVVAGRVRHAVATVGCVRVFLSVWLRR